MHRSQRFTGGNRRLASRPQHGCRYHGSWTYTAELQVTNTVAADRDRSDPAGWTGHRPRPTASRRRPPSSQSGSRTSRAPTAVTPATLRVLRYLVPVVWKTTGQERNGPAANARLDIRLRHRHVPHLPSPHGQDHEEPGVMAPPPSDART